MKNSLKALTIAAAATTLRGLTEGRNETTNREINQDNITRANITGANKYPFVLLPLPYAPNSLEPHIDTRTMVLHHDAHLGEYVNNLNATLKDYPELHNWTLEKLLFNVNKLPKEIQTAVRNNGGGVFNHYLYFDLLIKNGVNLNPNSDLALAINRDFGSITNLKSQLKTAGMNQFGSGWSWLVSNKDGILSVMSSANQDNFIEKNLTPVINIDVWEHSYYLLRQNRRDIYIDNFFKVLNWDIATFNYSKHKETDYS